ncbi:hypothetical protein C5L14_18635 [Labrys okinawensis]|uniref:YcxB-like C-terminal domain-containing protein n=1 Tax=Labrys okinawensis TaxID=346911 RepID=A0A2S9QA88_9HYPH|nr:YcxB family protein [Labrys okinawensis]PRH86255.1 hypothetical protein C5L14_18635 [Labrys okinawensis]
MSTNKISFQPTLTDCIHAYRFHYWRAAMAPKAIAMRTAFALGMIALGVFFAWNGRGSPADLTAAAVRTPAFLFWAIGAILIFVIGLPLLGQALVPRQVHRIYEQQKSLHLPFDISWNRDGAVVETGESRYVIPTANIRYWRESKEAFLLYQSDILFNFIMKRAFTSPRQLDSFRADLKASGSPER